MIRYIKFLNTIVIFCTSCTGMIDGLDQKNLGHGYSYQVTQGYPMISRDLPTYKHIPSFVSSYSFDNNFILALQLEYKADEKIGHTYSMRGNNDEKLIDLIKEKGVPKFWIISHHQDEIFGPLEMEDYLILREKLSVPNTLKLEILLKR